MPPLAPDKDAHQEHGFTLIELIIAAAIMVVLVGVAVTMLISAMRQQPELTDRANQIGDARNALERISVDLRQGEEVADPSPLGMTLDTYCDLAGSTEATPCSVVYECATESGAVTYACTRAVNGGAPTLVVGGLANPNVFCYESAATTSCADSTADPTYVGVTIEFPTARDAGRTVLEGGAALHNFRQEG